MCSFLPPKTPKITFTEHVRMVPTSPANTWENLMLRLLRRPVPEIVVPDTWENMLLRVLGQPIPQVMVAETCTIMHETFLPCNLRLYGTLNLDGFDAWKPHSYFKLAVDTYPYIPWKKIIYIASWESICSWEQIQHFGAWRSIFSSMNTMSSLRGLVLLSATLYYFYQYTRYFLKVSHSPVLCPLFFINTRQHFDFAQAWSILELVIASHSKPPKSIILFISVNQQILDPSDILKVWVLMQILFLSRIY